MTTGSDDPGDRVATEALAAVAAGGTSDPHAILGSHRRADGSTVVRTLRPGAAAVTLLHDGDRVALDHRHGGIFVGTVPGPVGDYRLEVTYPGADPIVTDDPYRWLPTVGDLDQHLFAQGLHETLWTMLGSHPRRYETASGAVEGTSFAVWAPNARGVRVAGDFDGWNGAGQPMRMMGSSGIWELFIPGVTTGTRYKYRLLAQDGTWLEKADPMAQACEVPPATASVVTSSHFQWDDADWLASRAATDWAAEPMSIYEVHAASWRRGLTYRQLADQLVTALDETGFTHVEFLPLAGHPFGGSWGYQVTAYYAIDPRMGTPDDFRYLVDTLHRHGYGVIMDWVPAHFPKDEWALARFDGTFLYEHADPQLGEHPDWGTLVFNYGRAEVRNFLMANALFWFDEFHIDGLRVDAVASMLYLDYSRQPGQWRPNHLGGNTNLDAVAFLQQTTATVGRRHPSAVMIAEESTSWPGVTHRTDDDGLGFGLKWNMGWMHDTLSYIGRDPIHRRWHHQDMTFSMVYAYSEQFVLPLSHDEVVHGKGSLWGRIPGDDWRKAATLRAYLAFQWAHPGKKLLFMGAELGDPAEWNDAGQVPWELAEHPLHAGIRATVADLNRHYRALPSLYEQDFDPAGFAWIDADDRDANIFSWLRFDRDGTPLACIVNFSPTPHHQYRLRLPRQGRWRELLNTDAPIYGGSGVGNSGGVTATTDGSPPLPAGATITVPPLGALWLVPEQP